MKHIVLIKLKERTEENQSAVAGILKKMNVLTIPYVHSFYVGEDFLNLDRSYDVLLEVDLDKNDLEKYASDPFHLMIKKEFAPYMDHSVTIDVD